MVRTAKIMLITALMPLFLISCGPEPPEQLPPVKKAQPPQPAASAAEQPAEAFDLADTEDGRPKRNPFLSHIVLLGDAGKPEKIRGPLECCELNLFRVLAVVTGEETGYALIQAPGTKRYIVRRGDVIGLREGRIIRVDTSSITVRENVRDSEGKVVSTVDEELSLPIEKDKAP